MIINFFKIAWRNLLRHKRMTFINVAGLGIGIAATILIVLWVQNELSFDSGQPDAGNIYLIRSGYTEPSSGTSLMEYNQYILAEAAANEIPEADLVTRMRTGFQNLHYNGDIITEKKVAYVDDKWFKTFHYDVVDGSIDPFLRDPLSLVITETAAKKYFGNKEAVGKVMRIDTDNYQVQAVVKDNPANSSFQYNILIPASAQLRSPRARQKSLVWGDANYITFIKLKPGSNAGKVEDHLRDIFYKNVKVSGYKKFYSLLPLTGLHFEHDVSFSGFEHGSRSMVNIFIVLAALLLITASINYVNLTTARASIRSKEVSIRKIVGASKSYLFGQFMSESFLVSFISILFSLVLLQACMPWYRDFTGKDFVQPVSSPLVWAIIGITLVVSFVLNGLYPAALLSSFQPLNVFRGKAILNLKDAGLRKGLVILQFTISVILIIGTLVIYRQLKFVEHADLGYNKQQVFTIDLPYKIFRNVAEKDMPAKLNTIKQELKAQSAIADVALANGTLVNFGNSAGDQSFDWSGKPKDMNLSVGSLKTDPDFQRVMNIKLAQGRWFNKSKADEHNVVLNETAVKMFGLKQPVIGQRMVHLGDTGVIVGVAKDFHYQSLHDKIGPMIINNFLEEATEVYVKTFPGNPQNAIAAAQKTVQKLAPDDPFVYSFLDDDYNSLYRTEQQSSVLIGLFAGIAILVSALGLLGLAAFAAEQRVKEIGIRKVLGASIRDIVQMLSSNFIRMVLIASLVAFPIAWWAMSKWLQNFAYKIELSWWLFAGAAGIALLIAMITVSAQAVKAASANPINSLRNE